MIEQPTAADTLMRASIQCALDHALADGDDLTAADLTTILSGLPDETLARGTRRPLVRAA